MIQSMYHWIELEMMEYTYIGNDRMYLSLKGIESDRIYLSLNGIINDTIYVSLNKMD